MSKGKDEAFETAYASVVENGWENVKHMAWQVWDMASATPPAAQVQGEQPEVVAYLILGRDAAGVVRQQRPTLAPFPGDMEEARQWARGLEIDSVPLMTVAQHERIVAALASKAAARAEDAAAWLVVAKYPHKETRRAVFLYEQNADDQGAEWCCDDGVVTITPLTSVALSAPPAAGVPDGWMLAPMEPLLNMMSDKDHDTRIMAERQLLAVLSNAPTPPASEQQQAVVMPDGWKAVPIEPTPEMREAFHDSYERYEDGYGECPDSQWKAMLRVAPTPPQENDL